MDRKKKIILIICLLLIILSNLFWGIYYMQAKEKFVLENELLKMELQEQKAKYALICEEKEQGEWHEKEKNYPYELFYGEWEITDVIYVDPMVVNGTYLSEEEINFFKEEKYAGQDERKIKFAENELVINETEVWRKIDYRVIIIPNEEDYELYHTMTLGDLGLTKDKADYYSYVEVLYGNSNEQALHFFIKDENTIILYWLGSYAIEYKRISYDGGSEKPIIILG